MAAERIQLLGCIDCVISGATHDLTLISCTGVSSSSVMSGRTYIEGGRVLANRWGTLNYLNASALSPAQLGGVGQYNKYKVDTSGGSVYINMDTEALNGPEMYFKVTAVGNSIIFSTDTNTETLDGNALPYTLSPSLYDCYCISSDGSNYWII